MGKKEQKHWADNIAERIIREKGNKKKYVCAAGITPSGTIHIGNFREIITVHLVSKALRDKGREVRFIYSWDDYDVFRKVPENMPKKEMLKKYLGRAIVDVPDPYGKEKSYARHNEVEVEESISKVGISPIYIYQAKKYGNCDYVKEMRIALQKKEEIRNILNNYRKEPLPKDWYPLSGYCPACHIYGLKFTDYDGENKLKVICDKCREVYDVDIRNSPFLKLPWRIDWGARWAYEKVDFEPGGKDHSTEGGSFSTGKEIVKLFGWEAPSYQMYDFISIKGMGGKISSSKGNIITLKNCLDIYEPDIIRWLFVGTRPNTEFAISFDLDVIKIYEDFDRCERIYFKKEKVGDITQKKQSRIYELSSVGKPPKKMPFQPGFRHLTNVLQTYSMDIKKTVKYYKNEIKNKRDEKRVTARAICASNWIKKYAPKEFKYSVNEKVPKKLKLNKKIKLSLKELGEEIKKKDFSDKELHEFIYFLIKKNGLSSREFFESAYSVLISRKKGPRLANFILTIGIKKVSKMFESIN